MVHSNRRTTIEPREPDKSGWDVDEQQQSSSCHSTPFTIAMSKVCIDHSLMLGAIGELI
jgi:hypothetical protein